MTTGYAPVNGMRMYYEIHGAGGTPLVLLHGGLFDVDQQFGSLLPHLSRGRQVVAMDFQGHGRTDDVDRPLTAQGLASDVVSSVSFHPDGDRGENTEAVAEMTVDMIAGTPMEQAHSAKSPHPDRLQDLLSKLSHFDEGFPGWSDDDIRGIAAPTLITVGDCDMVRLEHAVRFLQLRGGDVNGDFDGVPSSQLAVFPGTTHFFGLSRTTMVVDAVTTFLDTDPAPATVQG